MNAALVEYVGGIQVIKAFGRSGASFGKYSDAVNFFHDSTLSWWRQCWFWMAAVKSHSSFHIVRKSARWNIALYEQ